MDTVASDTRILAISAHPGTRYDAETRELARQLWSFKHGRNAEAVVRDLTAMAKQCPASQPGNDSAWPPGAPVPTARAVRRWAEEEGWADRAETEIVALAPALHRSIVVDLVAGAAESAAYLRAAVRGDAPAEPARVNAANSLLDRSGFKAREAPLSPGTHPSRTPADAPALTPAQTEETLRRMWNPGASQEAE